MIRNRGQDPQQVKEPVVVDLFKREILDSSVIPKNNSLTKEIMQYLDGKATITSQSGIFVIEVGKERTTIKDSFAEDESGLRQPGAFIELSALGFGWFRNSLKNVLGVESDNELYQALATEKTFTVGTNSNYPISLIPAKIFSDDLIDRLFAARKTVKLSGSTYASFFQKMFSEVLPEGFTIMGPYEPYLGATTAKALRSIVEKDDDYKRAVKAAEKVAEQICADAEKDPKAAQRKIFDVVRDLDMGF